MASRPIVPQQARGEAFPGANKQVKKNVGGGDGRSRRALGDIGNLVTVRGGDGKPQQPEISRPLTRSFSAQLLANAQAAAVGDNKTTVPVLLDVPVKKKSAAAGLPKPVVQRKVVPKPKKAEVIEISPDTEQVIEKKPEEKVNKKKDAEVSSKKKAPTLSSVLTARSKAACGITKKPKEEIIDIDAADASNDLAGVEYVEDIYTFYKSVENESRPNDYMHLQTEMNEKMRAILIDWLIDVHLKFELSPETLYLTINIIDRFLSVKVVPRRELQLVGMGAMLMASKYEEIWAPEVNDLVCIADRAYSHEQILIMEKTILGKLEWNLTVPTQYMFLVRFLKASIPDEKMENMVFFLAELGMMQYEIIMSCPSMVAASAVYAARRTLNMKPAWTETLKHHTGYSECQLMVCAKMLVCLHSKAGEGNKRHAVFKKYSNPQRGAVALIPPVQIS